MLAVNQASAEQDVVTGSPKPSPKTFRLELPYFGKSAQSNKKHASTGSVTFMPMAKSKKRPATPLIDVHAPQASQGQRYSSSESSNQLPVPCNPQKPPRSSSPSASHFGSRALALRTKTSIRSVKRSETSTSESVPCQIVPEVTLSDMGAVCEDERVSCEPLPSPPLARTPRSPIAAAPCDEEDTDKVREDIQSEIDRKEQIRQRIIEKRDQLTRSLQVLNAELNTLSTHHLMITQTTRSNPPEYADITKRIVPMLSLKPIRGIVYEETEQGAKEINYLEIAREIAESLKKPGAHTIPPIAATLSNYE